MRGCRPAKAGTPATLLTTRAEVDFQPGEGITAVRLHVVGDVPGMDAEAFAAHVPSADNFAAFPPSARKMLLGWVATAVRPETRASRVAKIAEAAARNERAIR